MSDESDGTMTEQRMQAMIDRAEFERLAQHVLRHGDPGGFDPLLAEPDGPGEPS